MQNVDLAAELEHASPVQKLLIFSAIKFYLNYFYESSQSTKFEELNIKGVKYDEIKNAPDVRLVTKSSTTYNVFQSSIFDFMLFDYVKFSGNDKNKWLNEIIDLEKHKKRVLYSKRKNLYIYYNLFRA
ncbi:MAG: hypothetical protein RCO49_05985 [Rickettsia endosymbiont of Argas persicus]